MQYSPKLKKVMEQIKNILKENDVAGIVVLHNIEGTETLPDGRAGVQGFSEYLFHINTSYSAARFENDKIILKGKAKHYPDKTTRDIKVGGAANMLDHLSEWAGRLSMWAFDMKDMVAKIGEIESTEGKHTSHDEQNN